MARFFATVEGSNVSEASFRQALDIMSKWRFDRRAWIIKAYYCQNESKVHIECEAPDTARFEQWLQTNGWGTAEISEIDLVFEAGAIWPMHEAVVS